MATRFDIPPSRVIPVSANERYNLTKLVDEFVRALPKEKKITVFRNVNKEFQSEATGEHVKQSFLEVLKDTVGEIASTIGDGLQDLGEAIEELPFVGKAVGGLMKVGGKVFSFIGDLFGW